MPTFTIKIDQLPPEKIEAADAREAAREVAAMLEGHEALQRLAGDGPVEIKQPDGRPWGRHLTIADFRGGIADEAAGDEGPSRPARP